MNAIPFLHTSRRRIISQLNLIRKIGVCAHPLTVTEYGSNQDMQFNQMALCGMTEYRVAINFNSNNTVGSPTKLQEVITKGATAGINIYPIISSSVNHTLTETENYNLGYSRGSTFATTWGANFRYIEIGNELENQFSPFTGDGSLISHFNTTKYGQAREWIRGVINGIYSVNKTIKFIINGGDKHFGWINQLILDGITIDVIAWHWYSDMETASPNYIAQKLIALYGDSNCEIWFNEVNSRSQDDAAQAVWMKSFNEYVLKYPRINKMFVYELFNEPSNANTAERNYGMFVYSGGVSTSKPLGDYFINLVSSFNIRPPLTTLVKDPVFAKMADPPYLERGHRDPVTDNETIKIAGGEYGTGMDYSKTCPMNCDGTLSLFGKTLKTGPDGGFATIVTKNTWVFANNPQWSTTNPYVFYMITSDDNSINKDCKLTIVTFNPGTNDLTKTTPYDFAANGWVDPSLGSGEGRISRDNRYLVVQGFYGVGSAVKTNCIRTFDIVANAFISDPVSIDSTGGNRWDYSSISVNGNHVIARAFMTSGGASAGTKNFLYTRDLQLIGELSINGSHPDLIRDANNEDIYVHVAPLNFVKLTDVTSTSSTETVILSNTFLQSIFGTKYAGHSSGITNLPGFVCVGGWGPNGESLIIEIATGKAFRYGHVYGTNGAGWTAPGYKYAEMTPCVWKHPTQNKSVMFTKSDWGIINGTVYTYAILQGYD